MITYSNRDAVNVSFGSDGRMLKRVNAGSAVQPSAAALLIAGPATGEESVETEPFIVSVDGALSGSITVSIAWAGVPNAPSAVSVVLSPASPTASVTTIPSSTGTLTVTATAAGLASAVATYSIVVAAPTVDFGQWQYWVDPEQAWESSWGTNPLAQTRKPRLTTQFVGTGSPDTSVRTVLLTDTTGQYDGSAAAAYVTLTPTQAQRGAVTPTFPLVERVADPAGGGFKVFRHTFDRTEHYGDGGKWRTQLAESQPGRCIPWGTEIWVAFGMYVSADMLLEGTRYDIPIQLYQGTGSRIAGGGFELLFIGGKGVPGAASMYYRVMAYENPNWLAGDYSNASAYIKERRGGVFISAMTAGWYWFVMQVREGCGYTDPTYGAIYGSVGPFSGGAGDGSEYYVRMWHAIGNGPPIASFVPYFGYWGGPHTPGHVAAADNVSVNGVLTNQRDQAAEIGIYSWPTWEAGSGSQRARDHKGVKAWRHQDGMDPIKVLEAFRG